MKRFKTLLAKKDVDDVLFADVFIYFLLCMFKKEKNSNGIIDLFDVNFIRILIEVENWCSVRWTREWIINSERACRRLFSCSGGLYERNNDDIRTIKQKKQANNIWFWCESAELWRRKKRFFLFVRRARRTLELVRIKRQSTSSFVCGWVNANWQTDSAGSERPPLSGSFRRIRDANSSRTNSKLEKCAEHEKC